MARTPPTIAAELAAIALISAIALGFGINSAGMASGYVDPLLHAGAQDEAVYGHAAARMVRTGEWTTPIFLERFMLNKPPLLMWLGATSMRLSRITPLALRMPVLASGVLCCVLVYWWVRRSQSRAAGIAGVALLLGTPVFHSISRKFMTDAPLTLFAVAAMFVIAVDPRWERRGTAIAFGVISGAAVMTKSAAGLLPLLIAAVFWILAGSKEGPPWRKLWAAIAVAALVAGPWHIYQFIVHRDWFVAEYVRFQLLGSGVTAPSLYTGDTNSWFYLRTLLLTDPILLVLWLTSLPWIAIAWKRQKPVTYRPTEPRAPASGPFGALRQPASEARLLVVWGLTTAACLMIFGTRAAYYLMPLLPALVLMAVDFSPLLRGRLAWPACAILLVAFAVKVWEGDAVWGLDYGAKTVASGPALDNYSRLHRTNELLIVSPDDEFYASVLDLPKVRYVYLSSLDATKTSEFFYRLGMILSSEEFCLLPQVLPVYEQRLRAWQLPQSLHPEATLIDSGVVSKLADVIRCSPDRDFMVPAELREVAVSAGAGTHLATNTASGQFFLLSKNSSHRPAGSIAPGTVVRE